MNIIGNRIQISVTEEEAGILQQALGRFIFHGPYWPPDQYPVLNDKETERADLMKKTARDMCEVLQDELLQRYQESEEIKFHYGRN